MATTKTHTAPKVDSSMLRARFPTLASPFCLCLAHSPLNSPHPCICPNVICYCTCFNHFLWELISYTHQPKWNVCASGFSKNVSHHLKPIPSHSSIPQPWRKFVVSPCFCPLWVYALLQDHLQTSFTPWNKVQAYTTLLLRLTSPRNIYENHSSLMSFSYSWVTRLNTTLSAACTTAT